MPKVSVIIPVYNAEKEIANCIQSVLNQSLKDLEIICVNDGSTDGSVSIVQEYMKKDTRLHLIEKENGGLVSARKTGVQAATADYVGFVDSDDWVEEQMYESLYELGKRFQADMVCSGYVMEGNYISEEYDTLDEGLYEVNESLLEKAIFNMPVQDLGIRGSLCCKLFWRESFTKVQLQIPNEISYSEDKVCMLRFLLECKRVYICHKAWYHYLINSQSMTQAPRTDYLNKINELYKYLVSLYTHPLFSENMRTQAELYVVQQLLKGINSRMGFSLKNLMWIDTDWLRTIPKGSNILIIGRGALADTYYQMIDKSNDVRLVNVVDNEEDVPKNHFDYLLVAVKSFDEMNKIKNSLLKRGIQEKKILWFEHKEIFWKYAQAFGLCEYESNI